ncbi:MAG TPA: hypothetical protein DF383_13055 [Deltaproteobacteria bacterium]|nr:hypothetical protein [Deltaproteobacteria bacterium]
MKKFLTNWGPVLGYASLIFVASSFRTQVRPGLDKVVHAFEYAVMGFFTTRAVLLSWDLPKLWGLVSGASFALLLGILDEFHQYFVPGRNASVFDAMADAVGAVLGALLFISLGNLLYQSEKLYPRHDKCC